MYAACKKNKWVPYCGAEKAMAHQIYSYDYLKKFTQNVFLKFGFSSDDAEVASDVLLAADLRGIDSHGVARLKHYVRLLEIGRAKPAPSMKIEHETPSTATLDADHALGLIAGPRAMEIAIEKAKTAGTGWVAVNNTNHFGIAGYHAMLALKHDMIGIAMTNASPLVAPTFSKDRMLGTNPIAVAMPAQSQPPLVIDMATTTATNGKLEIYQRKNEPVPLGWVQDQDGAIVTDPRAVEKKGALLPLGSDYQHASYKGYCLGSMVDILSAVLSGANYGPWAPPFVTFLNPSDQPVGKGIGHFLGAMRVDAFRPADEFKHHMDNWIHAFRNARTIEGQDRVIIPGDPEREMDALRRRDGIPLLLPVVRDLKEVGQKAGIEFAER